LTSYSSSAVSIALESFFRAFHARKSLGGLLSSFKSMGQPAGEPALVSAENQQQQERAKAESGNRISH